MRGTEVVNLYFFMRKCGGPIPHWMVVERYYQHVRIEQMAAEAIERAESSQDDPLQ
jgi:hypothetical protein